jgi:hypothetical protein
MVRDYAFYNSANLKTAHFPGATSIGVNAFIGCKKLTKVYFPAATTIGANAFMSCEVLAEADFPLVTTINNAAFAYCYSLSTLNVSSLTRVETRAFWGCSRLASVILRGQTMCTISNSDAFGGTPIASGSGYVYVPDNLVDSYKTAQNWSTYANQIKPLSEFGEGS